MLLQDKICVITGAASERGIGRACAHLFVEHGATVVLLDLDGKAVARTAQTLGPTHLSFELDVSDRAACRKVIAQVLKLVPRIDCLINNAGIAQPLGTLEIEPEDYDLVLRALRGGHRLGVVAERLLSWRNLPTRLSQNSDTYTVERFVDCKAAHIADNGINIHKFS